MAKYYIIPSLTAVLCKKLENPWIIRNFKLLLNIKAGDSGLYSNTRDVIEFGQMLLNEGKRIFSKASIALMLRKSSNNKKQRIRVNK